MDTASCKEQKDNKEKQQFWFEPIFPWKKGGVCGLALFSSNLKKIVRQVQLVRKFEWWKKIDARYQNIARKAIQKNLNSNTEHND